MRREINEQKNALYTYFWDTISGITAGRTHGTQ